MHQLVDQYRDSENDDGHQHLAELRGYRLMMHNDRYRLYLEYYDYGDMYHIVQNLLQHDDEDAEPGPHLETRDSDGGRVIPENFLWYFLHGIVEGCLVLQKGKGNRKGKVTGWRPIQHADLTVMNVFLQPAEDEKKWPIPVVGDFGLAFYTQSRNPAGDNPKHYGFDTQMPRYPPEMQPRQWSLQNPYQIDQKADVWMIGVILWVLITRRHSEEGPLWDNGGIRSSLHTMPPAGNTGVLEPTNNIYDSSIGIYRPRLLALVRQCLSYYPWDRPTLKEIKEEIEEHWSDFPDEKNDMRSMRFMARSEFHKYRLHPDYRRSNKPK
ncbi:hypothetical protein BU24DRAFT_418964 [Aaosphaeria arxii CBS 175.79]|uniref:Protein kinase domain-containing protein n=1 Tax=Aaosphaeria arxii CBS 175.79 TaxID=1450172 RepID=A0A6A5Y398_9PLEO|nr:uncharacterized protein BU24DRAFT_418964 [Aaosphaeria arxii CBS 175.79]KAF2019351.1 hypothetical protein BU24DRAFT_418964 [Aaosphaeria arxii CBS 175.79]